jgi:hypothetical protein
MYDAEIPATSAEHKHRKYASSVPSGTPTQDTTVQVEDRTRLKPVGVPVNLTYKNISKHEQHIKNAYCARTTGAIHSY